MVRRTIAYDARSTSMPKVERGSVSGSRNVLSEMRAYDSPPRYVGCRGTPPSVSGPRRTTDGVGDGEAAGGVGDEGMAAAGGTGLRAGSLLTVKGSFLISVAPVTPVTTTWPSRFTSCFRVKSYVAVSARLVEIARTSGM